MYIVHINPVINNMAKEKELAVYLKQFVNACNLSLGAATKLF